MSEWVSEPGARSPSMGEGWGEGETEAGHTDTSPSPQPPPTRGGGVKKQLRELADVHYGKSPNEVLTVDSDIPIIGTGGVYGRASRALFNGPAVVVPRKGSLGNPQYAEQPFWPVDTTYAVIPKSGVDAKWLYYSLAAFDLTKLNEATGVPSISRDWLFKIQLGSAEYPQQRRIAEILSTLDEVIEQTEALIAKMQQVKAGLIHDLFTRGVTPDGRLRPTREQAPELYKESPLGWIPKEWEVERLSCFAHFTTSGSRGWAEYYSEDGPIFIRIGNLTREHINFRWDNVVRVSPPKSAEGQRTAVMPNDILISITADLGIVAVADKFLGEAYVNQHIALVRPICGDCTGRFIGHYLTTSEVQKQFIMLNDSGAKAGLNLPTIRNLIVTCPQSEVEAQRIVASVDACDVVIEAHKRELKQLKYQKHGLMGDLLSGRVRELARGFSSFGDKTTSIPNCKEMGGEYGRE